MFRRICIGVLVAALIAVAGCSRDPEKAKHKYLESGQKYMEQGKYREAEIQFKNAVRIDPKFADAQFALASADAKLSQWGDAFNALQQVISIDPNRNDAHISLGQMYLAAGQFDKAEGEANSVLEREPRNAAALQLLGSSYVGRSQNEKARDTFAKLVEVTPNEASAYGNLGLVEIALKRFDDAEKDLNKALELNPKFISGYTNLANYFRLRSQLPKAEQVLEGGVAQNPQENTLYLSLAEVLIEQGRTDAVETTLEKLRQLKPASSETSVAIGDFYFSHGNSDRALSEYKRGLGLEPTSLMLKDRSAEVLLSANRVNEARSLNDEVLAKSPKDPVGRVHHARILIADHKPDDAIAELQKQATDTPEYAQVHHALGVAYWQKGNIDQARTSFQNAIKFDEKMVVAWRALAALHLSLGEAKIAKEYAQHVVQLAPTSASDRLLLGNTLSATHEMTAARQQYSIAQQLDPNDPAPHVQTANSLAAEKKNAAAEAEYEAALKVRGHGQDVMSPLLDFLVATNQTPKALARARQYATTYPGDAAAHYMLASVLTKSNSYDEAKVEADRAIQADANFLAAYLILGKIHQALHQTDLAVARYEQAARMQPDTPPLQTLIGNLYMDKGDLPKARYYYEQALAVNPNFAVAASNLAWLYTQQGSNLDVALGLAQRAKQLMPEMESITDTLGWVHYKRGNYSAAVPLFRECVQKAPEHATYRYHLGMTLLATGETQKGRTELEAALRYKLVGNEATEARTALAGH